MIACLISSLPIFLHSSSKLLYTANGFGYRPCMLCKLKLRGCPESINSKAIIIQALFRERYACFLKEFLPADTCRPVAEPFILIRIACINIHDLFNYTGHFGPARPIIRQSWNNNLGELWYA